jgi:TRAP-type C4-dicarboxylate transport system substrate-binding protein
MDKMVDMIVKSYITVMGEEKWNSLTDEQKHDAIMTIAKDALNRINNI